MTMRCLYAEWPCVTLWANNVGAASIAGLMNDPNSTCFDLLWICCTTNCKTKSTIKSEVYCKSTTSCTKQSPQKSKPTTDPHHPDMSIYRKASCTTCCPTNPQGNEVVELWRVAGLTSSHLLQGGHGTDLLGTLSTVIAGSCAWVQAGQT